MDQQAIESYDVVALSRGRRTGRMRIPRIEQFFATSIATKVGRRSEIQDKAVVANASSRPTLRALRPAGRNRLESRPGRANLPDGAVECSSMMQLLPQSMVRSA